jgi:glutathione S-transferase
MALGITHYGWLVSPYSAKTRSYLRYKQIDFVDKAPTAFVLYRTIQKAVGRMIMPTVQLADGSWLQDSSDIIDAFEQRKPEPAVKPTGVRQAFFSALAELYADEWLPMLALHYRWNVRANVDFAVSEFARYGFPWLPKALGRRLVLPMVNRMRGYLPVLGVAGGVVQGVEEHAKMLVSVLNNHFSEHAFLLGDRPCLGDFSVYGPLYAHLFRDPGSTALFDDAPQVRDWMQRMAVPRSTGSDFVADDAVPESLDPLVAAMVADLFAWLQTLIKAIDGWCEKNPEATRVPRALGYADFRLGEERGSRKLITFVQYKAQRPLDIYAGANEEERAKIDTWLERACGRKVALPTVQHPFERKAFKTRLKSGN